MKDLTRAEEQVMRYLWRIRSGFLKQIIEQYPEPKPAYTTVSTVIRVLVKKGFISYRTYGKTHEYYPLVNKDEYSKFFLKTFVSNYFEGSFHNLVSFFAKENDMNINEVEVLMKHVKDDLKDKNNE